MIYTNIDEYNKLDWRSIIPIFQRYRPYGIGSTALSHKEVAAHTHLPGVGTQHIVQGGDGGTGVAATQPQVVFSYSLRHFQVTKCNKGNS